MLDFYTLDSLNIIIIVVSTAIIYKLLDYSQELKEKNYYKIVISLFCSIILSIGVSYFMIENDTILKSNFWE